LGGLADAKLKILAAQINDWRITPAGTEGYRDCEVTLGGVDTNDLDSKTMQARAVPGLYFIGEVWTSPAGWAAIISNGPGRPAGAPEWRSEE